MTRGEAAETVAVADIVAGMIGGVVDTPEIGEAVVIEEAAGIVEAVVRGVAGAMIFVDVTDGTVRPKTLRQLE